MPASFQSVTAQKAAVIIPEHQLARLDTAACRALDIRDGVKNRYGVAESVGIDLRAAAVKSQSGNTTVWRYRIDGEGAVSLGLNFSTFDIPEGAALYVYSPDGSVVRGAFTSVNTKDFGGLTVADFDGESLVIEYNEPVGAAFEGGVVLGSVVKSYQSLTKAAKALIQINCTEGADWQTQKRAVCMITFVSGQYSYYCSGSLVNNAREDETPYFLTANHCISTSSEASTVVAYFNYEMTGCATYDATRNQSLSGAVLKATNSYSDFCLLVLSETPPKAYSPYFAGWDATGSGATSGTCIHHPQGGSKCIALDSSAPVSNSYSVQWDDGSISQVNSHWEVSYEAGADQGGSSGGPLFDQNKRIIGQLHGGDDESSLFGKFSLSWNYRSEASRQLKSWLDPDNTGIKQLNGRDGYSIPVAAFSVSEAIACLDVPIKLTDESRSAESWAWNISPSTYTFVNGTDAASQNPQVQFTAAGSYTISLTVANSNGSDEVTQTNRVVAYSTLPVQLVDVADEMTVCGWELDQYTFAAEGAPFYGFSLTVDGKFVKSVSENVLTLSLTDEAKTEGSFDTYVAVTGFHGSCEAADSVLLHVVIPSNDNVAQALSLALGYNGSFSNACGSVEDNEPAPATTGCSVENNWCPPAAGSVLDNSVWFKFEGPSSGKITIQTEGVDTQIAVYRAVTPAYLLSGSDKTYTMLAAADDGLKSSNSASLVDLDVIPGASYWLQVDGTDGAEGDFEVTLLSNTIEVYPNPSTGLYHLTVASSQSGAETTAELSVYTQTGQLVYWGNGTFSQRDNTIDFDLSGQPAGIYFFRAVMGGVVLSKKLILLR